VEGEKDVHTLESWGLVASCNPGGSGSSHLYAKWLEYFRGRNIVILPDNDEPGRKHAAIVASALFNAAASVCVLELPELPARGDVTDWWNAGGTAEQLKELLRVVVPLNESALSELRARWNPASEQKTEVDEGNRTRSTPFEVAEHGVFFLKEGDDGTTEAIRLAARVDVVAKTRDPSSDNWGRLLRWKDEEGCEHQWAMPMEALASDAAAVRARLLSEGLPYITTNARLRERFTEYIQTAPTNERARCVSRVGWHGDTYVLPDQAIGPADSEQMLYQTLHEPAHHWNVSGTAEEWRDLVGRRCSGNSRLIMAVSCGFAGPILRLLDAESGGIPFHGTSSTGKSTALIVGASVCGGGGQAGFVQTWRTTLNGLEAVAESHNDGTLFLDELAQVDPYEAAETAYVLCNGQGKLRMTRSFTARKKLNWSLLCVSAGEITLAEQAASVGKRTKGGADVRL